MKKQNNIGPEFIKIHSQLLADKRITPLDKIVYGAILWYTGLSNGRCTATNQTISEITYSTPGAVSNSLTRLEKNTYIKRIHMTGNPRIRTEIIPLTLGRKSAQIIPLTTTKDSTSVDEKVTSVDEKVTSVDVEIEIPVFKEKNQVGYEPNNKTTPFVSTSVDVERESIERIGNKNREEETFFNPSDIKNDDPLNGKILPLVKTYSSEEDLTNVKLDVKSNASLVNDAIALFLPILPGDFVGKSTAFGKMPTRTAVENLLKRYSLEQLKTLIQKYDDGKSDQFRPSVGTVYEFCTFKLAKIEAFVTTKKPEKVLWAQRSISTPEQRAESDKTINSKIEIGREKLKKAREEWEAKQK